MPLYVIGVAAAAVIGAAVARSSNPGPEQRITSAGPTVHNRGEIAAPAPSARQSTLDTVRALARRAGPASELIREAAASGGCVLVPVGQSPARAIQHAVRSLLPAFTVTTTARTLDQFTGLCSLDLRSPRVAGAVLVVSVSSPARSARASFDHVSTGFETTGSGTATKYVLTVKRDGWRVLVGATGSTAGLPAVEDLLTLAGRRGLTW